MMPRRETMVREAMAFVAQSAVFLVGLVLSLVVGIFLVARMDGPGGLLAVTILSGAGLLGSASLSQWLFDRIVDSGDRP